jgi:hypothetical protein
MSCSLKLYEHENYGGDHTHRTTTFTSTDDGNSGNMSRIADRDSSGKVSGPCAWVVMEHPKGSGGGGFVLGPNENAPSFHNSNHHGEGKGSTNHRWYKRGDRVGRVVKIVLPTDGYYDDINIYAKRADGRTGQWGHFPWVTDALLDNPNDSEQLITSTTDKGQPCPGAEKATIIGHRSYRCTYKNEGQITNLKSGTRATGDPRRAMFNNIYDKFCNNTDNAFTSPGGQSCLERSTGIAIAKTYCSEDDNIKSDANCTKESLNKANYDSLAAAYCESNPNDSFCSCYNVVKDKCADDKKTGVKGCAATSEYVDLRNATPSEFRSVWNGQRKCGSICTGGDKYIPDNNQAGCKTTIQICAQDINVGSMSESDIKASCELNASDGSSAGEPPPAPSPAQDSAKSELDEAKAALARGDAGAQERVDAAEAALDAADESAVKPISLTDFRTNPRSYIPNSLDGLKTNRKQQIGAAAMGALVLGCMMMLLLLVASAGGGGAVKKRFR